MSLEDKEKDRLLDLFNGNTDHAIKCTKEILKETLPMYRKKELLSIIQKLIISKI
jgi:hypothetical protein